jgi:iron complex transport system ATP-binding protein
MTMYGDHPQLDAVDVSLGYDDRVIVDHLSLSIPMGRVTAIVGANACGKSTLLRGLARLLAPSTGTVLLDGQDIARLPTRAVAARVGILPQQPSAPDGLTVADPSAAAATHTSDGSGSGPRPTPRRSRTPSS